MKKIKNMILLEFIMNLIFTSHRNWYIKKKNKFSHLI